jgi:WD40 repeat protein
LTLALIVSGTARAQAPNGLVKLRELVQKPQISGAAFSHDGTRIITCDWTGTARTWIVATGMPHDTFEIRPRVINGNGDEGEKAEVDQLLRLKTVLPWNGKSWLIQQPEGFLNWQPGKPAPGTMYAINQPIIAQYAKGPLSVLVLTSDNPEKGAYSLVDLKTRKTLSTLRELNQPISLASFSADGRRLLTHCANGSLTQVWDLKKGTLLHKLGSSGTAADHQNAVAISANGARGVGGFRTLRLWDLRTGEERAPIGFPPEEEVLALGITPDASRVVALTTATKPVARIHVFHLETGALLGQGDVAGELNGDIDQDLIISPDGTLLVTFRGPRQPGIPMQIGGARIWQLPPAN